MEEGYCAISGYGIVGDMNSAALVSKEGSIDWLCFPRFDSASVFAAILDPEGGGRFRVRGLDPKDSKQEYVEDTNILRTEFHCQHGDLELIDYMPCYLKGGELEAFHEVHRRVRCVRGSASVQVLFQPRFCYGLDRSEVWTEEGGCLARGSREWLSLATDLPLRADGKVCSGEERLEKGDERWLVLRWNDNYLRPVDEFRPAEKLEKTTTYWREWVRRCDYKGPFASFVRRSILTLKLLIYEPTGAMVAAPTTSLPEVPGGGKNWDYRYAWLRDSAFVLSAFHACGYKEEERRYRRWIIRRLRGHTVDPENLRILHGVEEDAVLEESVLHHLEGHRGAGPVRMGNAAHAQFQLDVYGSVLDALYFSYHSEEDMNDDVWRTVEALANFVAANWRRPDSGIWELRGQQRRYVYSQVMAWVAMDRAIRIAQRWGNLRRAKAWARVRDEIRQEVLSKGFDREMGSFVQYYGSKKLDASLLILPLVGFLPADDPMFRGTLENIVEKLGEGFLIRRFKEAGPQEGAFLMLGFWLVEALALAGELDRANRGFEELTGLANHLGLYAEMIDPESKEFLGNFPQAFTHMALVNAAVTLQREAESAKARGR